MCYSIPGKLIAVEDNVGVINYFGEKRKAIIDLSNVSVGDYVYAQGGVIISKIPEKEAEEILEFWKDKFFTLKKNDKKLAKVDKVKASSAALGIFQKIS